MLYKSENVGGYDVRIDPKNSNIVYASLWAARQAPWEIGDSFEIAGSGIFKSTDGGTTWKPLTNGLPKRVGRISLSIAPSQTSRVYAYVDKPHDDAAIYRSDDAGAHFTRMNNTNRIAERGDDLASITADPKDANTVYVSNTTTYRSRDGGKTFVALKGAPGGDDYHSIWINPRDPSIILLGSDQGATLSLNDGRTWSSWYGQPTAEMYHVLTDNRFPYWVCGGQQESGSACVRSRGEWGEITQRDWYPVGAEEYGYVAPDPLHSGVFFGGKVERYDHATGQTQEVGPMLLPTKGYRVVRTQPIAFDPLDRKTLYFAANTLFSTTDGGKTWTQRSPDLTRAHPGVPSVVGPFEADDPQKGLHRGVIYAIALSYKHEGTIWAGTDDGLMWVTRDGGVHWTNVTPTQLTPWSKVSQIDASHFDDGSAYVAVNRFRLDDLHPYVYVTHDYGAHWQLAVNGLPQEPVNAVREDPLQRGLLYAATETGVSVSFDDGAQWQSLQMNLPPSSARDIVVHGNDLVVATHGRGFWILDDVEPLRALARTGTSDHVRLFAPELAYRVRRDTNTDTPLPPEVPHGTNPPHGAIIDYALPSQAKLVTISIYNQSGELTRRYSSADVEPAYVAFDKPRAWERPFRKPSIAAGMHRFVWDLHEPAPRSVDLDLPINAVYHDTPRVPQGAIVVPGIYRVVLDVDGTRITRPLKIAMDPTVPITSATLQEQYAMSHELALLTDRTFAVLQKAKAAHNASAVTRLGTLNEQLSTLLQLIDGADATPTTAMHRAYCSLVDKALPNLGAMPMRSSPLCPVTMK